MIKKTANKNINTSISGAVPHPFVVFPNSEFNGLKSFPNGVTIPSDEFGSEFDILFFEKIVTQVESSLVYFLLCKLYIYVYFKIFNLHVLQKGHAIFLSSVQIQYILNIKSYLLLHTQ